MLLLLTLSFGGGGVRCHPDQFVEDSGYCPTCTSHPAGAYARHMAPQPDLWVLLLC